MILATEVFELKTISPIPNCGEKQLSINAAVADVEHLWNLADEFGFSLELVKIPYLFETEVHILFWKGAIADAPENLEEVYDTLSDQYDCSAIHYAYSPNE